MVEKFRDSPREVLKKGDLVKLKENIDPKVIESIAEDFQPGIAYRVLHFEHHEDDGGDAVWLGPNDMSPQDVEDFRPELATELSQERYKGVLPLATKYLRKILN